MVRDIAWKWEPVNWGRCPRGQSGCVAMRTAPQMGKEHHMWSKASGWLAGAGVRGWGGMSLVTWAEHGGGRPWRAVRRLWAWSNWVWEVKWLGEYPATLHHGPMTEGWWKGIHRRQPFWGSEKGMGWLLQSKGFQLVWLVLVAVGAAAVKGIMSSVFTIFLELFLTSCLHVIKNKSRSQQQCTR